VATVTPTGSSGWIGVPQTWVEFVTLNRPNPTAGWRVASVETTS